MDELVGMASMMLMMMLLLPVTGVLMAVTPFLQRRGEVFAVTVPSSAQRDPYLRSLKRRYALIMGAVTAVLTAAGVAAALAMNEAAIMVVLLVGTLGLLLGGYALMLRYRAKTKAYKREQGWRRFRRRWPWWARPTRRAPSRCRGICCTCRSSS